ncbi:adult-specific cuticular protein ACP-22-like isoform X2 [Agrilus planipennis]|uniref:Adult-specific cuticular protein ACP-22-like isoform X2 n=1 Tax=Agrilus planipennis TaxID=224129 RepID=A0A1W4WU79_AGRPL|nr:adult-specific cuticular protein ACP-22-like isoform X2 [Agrilus planipennis]
MNSVLAFLLLCIVTIATGSYYHNNDEHYQHDEYENGPAQYHFNYGVHDPHTGDKKSQHEERDGHNVKGAYSLDEPDGTKRIVEYEAGPHGGFQAHVRRVGHAQHPYHYSNGGHHEDYDNGHYENGHHDNGHGSAESYVGTTHWGYHH